MRDGHVEKDRVQEQMGEKKEISAECGNSKWNPCNLGNSRVKAPSAPLTCPCRRLNVLYTYLSLPDSIALSNRVHVGWWWRSIWLLMKWTLNMLKG